MSASRIVLIEDNPGDVYLVEMALRENGIACELTRFDNGEDALKAFGADGFTADAILLDLNTPKCDGFEVLSRLKSTPRLAKVPVAIITSSAAPRDKARCDVLGATRYIQKPSDLEEFLTTVGQGVKEMLGC